MERPVESGLPYLGRADARVILTILNIDIHALLNAQLA